MEKEFIPYEQALALKELGFDEPCLAMFDEYKIFEYNSILHNANILIDCVSAPLYPQAFRWFREKYGLWVRFSYDENELEEMYWYVDKEFEEGIGPLFFDDLEEFSTYEEAELECLKKLIEISKRKTIIKKKNNNGSR
jgi:hypothetical protein